VKPSTLASKTIGFQATYYILSALWPLISMTSFEAVTGPKSDVWLVRMVALLILVIGLTLASAVISHRETPEIYLCSILSCLSFIAIDVIYSMAGQISKVYLGDAAVEALIVITLGVALAHRGP
jgi:hypothetical protein